MRWDMYKVIVERPRIGGSHAPSRKRADQRARQDPEHAPLREPISRGRGSKHLNENLAPLRRYLLGQVGRRWDAVHAEISAGLRLTSAVQRHVLEHLDQSVARHVRMVGERPAMPVMAVDGRPLRPSLWRDVVYVCPRTGLLRRTPPRGKQKPPPERDRVVVADGDQLQRLGGVWYHVHLEPVPPLPADCRRVTDVVTGLRLDDPEGRALALRLYEQYGRMGVYAARKLQLGKRALARLVPAELR